MLPSEHATDVVADRQVQYGHPADVYMVAEAMYAPLEPYLQGQVAIPTAVRLICVKIAREIVGQHSDDNLTDVCGYTNVWHMIRERQAEVAIKIPSAQEFYVRNPQ